MGTRGFITFVADKAEKTTYNHFDSYPGGLGVKVLWWLRTALASPDTLRKAVADLRVVGDDSTPTAEDVERLSAYADLNVSARDPREWYVLLRETQGNPALMLQAGVIEDAGQFPLDSLFAEWGYVIDLDGQRFEVYRGFQQSPHDKGRFASRGGEQHDGRGLWGGGYHPVALAHSWPLDALPTDDAFLATFEENE